MKSLVKNAFAGLCIAATFLFVSSTAGAQVLAQSGDVAASFGFGHGNYSTSLGSPVTNNHMEFGFSGGYNLSDAVTVLGEYSYMPMGSYSGVDFKTQLFGGGVRFNLAPSSKVVPYALFAVGGNRFTGSASGASVSANGYYVGFGGGASIYFGKNWGVRPEFRYERQSVTFEGIAANSNVIVGSGSVFFQFGGEGGKKKKASTSTTEQ